MGALPVRLPRCESVAALTFHALLRRFTAHVIGSIDNRNILQAKLYATTITMGCNGLWFGTMPFPELTLLGGASTALNVTAFVTITDPAAFDVFSIALLQQDEVVLNLKSHVRTSLRAV